jgi:hypothetical protein
LQDCEAQERCARDLQKPAAQATPGLITRVGLLIYAKITRS